MATRVAVMAVIVKNPDSVAQLNGLLHQYSGYIIGRTGVPYHQRGVSVISALSGKVGRLPGITAKTVYAPEEALS